MARKQQILTPEDKEILNSMTRYLKSHNVKEGDIEIEIEGSFPFFDDIKNVNNFSNSWDIKIPEEYFKILEKVWEVAEPSFDNIDVDDINYERIFISLDAINRELTVQHHYSYFEENDTNSTLWDLKGDEKDNELLNEVFKILKELYPKDRNLNLRYNGSGDSGYIEDFFDNNKEVPSVVEDWAYEVLGNLHGGWEINEGSQGDFYFDLKNETVTLNHTYNEEVQESNTLFEEKF